MINYRIDGEGDTIVLVHGLSDSLEYWEPLVSVLKDEYRIIRYDLRGHGQSPLGNDEISIDLFVNDLNNLLKRLNVKKSVLVGFSLGGVIALEYTIRYPGKVSSLVLMSSFSKCTPHIKSIFLDLSNAVSSSFEEFYDQILPKVLCPSVITEYQEELLMIKEIASENANTLAIGKALNALLNFDIDDKLDRINIPTLILSGKYDDFIPLSTQEDMHRKISKSDFIVLDNVKHNLLLGENILKIGNIIKNFVQ